MKYPATFELPTTDQLTSLLSSPYFRHLLREEILPSADKSEDPVSLFMVDIDNFLAINTNYGHQAGDQVLVSVAKTLQESMPERAVLARYSGDEFAGVLPDTRLDDTFMLVEEFRRRVVGLSWPEWPDLRMTCSIGLAAYQGGSGGDAELVRDADQALYVAKSTGRNKVSLPLGDSRMITKTSHYTSTQLERLAQLARAVKRNEASILREALDDALKKYNDLMGAAPRA